jgi:hypothetical protein
MTRKNHSKLSLLALALNCLGGVLGPVPPEGVEQAGTTQAIAIAETSRIGRAIVSLRIDVRRSLPWKRVDILAPEEHSVEH